MRSMVSVRVPESRLSPSSAVRAVATTLAPSCASRAAMAAPMPRLAPVTTATLSFRTPFGLTLASAIMPLLPLKIRETDAPMGETAQGVGAARERRLSDAFDATEALEAGRPRNRANSAKPRFPSKHRKGRTQRRGSRQERDRGG